MGYFCIIRPSDDSREFLYFTVELTQTADWRRVNTQQYISGCVLCFWDVKPYSINHPTSGTKM